MNPTSDKFYLRLAREDDIDLLFTWANDQQVRQNAFHTEEISYTEHQKWFSNLIKDESQIQYIFMLNDMPIGQIRFSIAADKAMVDYSIAPHSRGNGYGKLMLNLAHEELKKTRPFIKLLIGQVKRGNHASEMCFIKSGYTETFKQFELEFKE